MLGGVSTDRYGGYVNTGYSVDRVYHHRTFVDEVYHHRVLPYFHYIFFQASCSVAREKSSSLESSRDLDNLD